VRILRRHLPPSGGEFQGFFEAGFSRLAHGALSRRTSGRSAGTSARSVQVPAHPEFSSSRRASAATEPEIQALGIEQGFQSGRALLQQSLERCSMSFRAGGSARPFAAAVAICPKLQGSAGPVAGGSGRAHSWATIRSRRSIDTPERINSVFHSPARSQPAAGLRAGVPAALAAAIVLDRPQAHSQAAHHLQLLCQRATKPLSCSRMGVAGGTPDEGAGWS